MSPLIFYFPYPTAGGVSVLFIRLAEQLSNLTKCILVDSNDGFMALNCPKNVDFIGIHELEKLPPDGIFITQSCPPWSIPFLSKLPENMRFFFWNLHPDNLTPALITGRSQKYLAKILMPFDIFLSFLRKSKMRKFLKLALYRNAIVFMDLANAKKTKENLNYSFQPVMLPVCSSNPPKDAGRIALKTPVINCAWLGRTEGFKTSVLIHLIERLSMIEVAPINLKIFGSGSDIAKIELAASKYPHLNCEFYGPIEMSAIARHLQGCEVLFAMGTSALEGASLRIPTICLDYSHHKIRYLLQFKLLYEMEGFNLGKEINNESFERLSTLGELLLNIKKKPESFGEKCYAYWEKNHSPEMTSRKFLTLVYKTKLTCSEIKKLKLSTPDAMTMIKSKIFKRYSIDGWQYF